MSRNFLRTAPAVRSFVTCCRCKFHETTVPSLTVAMQQPQKASHRSYSAEAAEAAPAPKQYPEHIVNVVDTISKLTLGEVAALNELLKAKLNIQDAPMMPMMGAPGMAAMGAPAAAAADEASEEAEAPVVEQ